MHEHAYISQPGSAVLKPAKKEDLSRMQNIASDVYKLLEVNQISSGAARIILSMVKSKVLVNRADLDQRYFERR